MLFTAGVQPVALNLSQNARGRVPVLPYVVPTALSAQSSASTAPAKQGIPHTLTVGVHTVGLVPDLAAFTSSHPAKYLPGLAFSIDL